MRYIVVEQFYIKQNPLWFQCFALGSYEKFQPGFWDQKKGKDPGDEFGREIRETKQTSRNTKILTIAQPADRDPDLKNWDLGNRTSPPSHINTSKILQRI